MRPPSSLKKEILKNWMMGLKVCNWSSKEMTLLERKKAIKLSADIAMASARNGATFWSRALIANASKDMITTSKLTPLPPLQGSRTTRITRRKRILVRKARTSKNNTRRPSERCAASLIAKRLVKKRTQVLKGLVPGGKYMDDSHLIRETLDYMISLQAQVHVMQHLANATDRALQQ
ncbi:hypothetical protein Ancab_027710 [Ancistrocladus abbreviatus]